MTEPKAYMTGHDLKKQSQFVAGQMDVSSLQRKDYENRLRPGLRANKASQSQRPAYGDSVWRIGETRQKAKGPKQGKGKKEKCKTKPICERPSECNHLLCKEL
jgi:hypothetical protein